MPLHTINVIWDLANTKQIVSISLASLKELIGNLEVYEVGLFRIELKLYKTLIRFAFCIMYTCSSHIRPGSHIIFQYQRWTLIFILLLIIIAVMTMYNWIPKIWYCKHKTSFFRISWSSVLSIQQGGDGVVGDHHSTITYIWPEGFLMLSWWRCYAVLCYIQQTAKSDRGTGSGVLVIYNYEGEHKSNSSRQ